MTTAVSNYFKAQRKIYAKVNAISFPEVNWKVICFTGFFIALALLVFYVLQINYLTGGSYSISSYEKEISQLSEENKKLQISFAESSFLGYALQKIQAMNFQKVTSVKYIQIPDSSVATIKK